MKTTFAAHSVPPERELPEAPLETTPALAVLPKEVKGHIGTTTASIELAYADRLAAGSITEDQVAQLTWLLNVGKSEHLNLRQLSKRIGYESDTTLHRVFSGKYEADLGNVFEKIAEYKKLWELRLGVTKSTFVTTSLSHQIFQACDLARMYQVIVPIYGDSQTGKSTALEEYRRLNNHGRTIYVAMPAGGHLTKFLKALCRALGLSPNGNNDLIAQRVIGALNDQMLLIVDEIHQTCLCERGGTKFNTIEFIRLEIYEAIKCGVVLCGTNVFRDEVDKGRHQALLEQTRRRGMAVLQLPAMLDSADMDAIAASFGFPPAPKAIHEVRVGIIRRHGLRAYTNYMRAGAKIAFKRAVPLTWDHFVSAHDTLVNFGKGGASK